MLFEGKPLFSYRGSLLTYLYNNCSLLPVFYSKARDRWHTRGFSTGDCICPSRDACTQNGDGECSHAHTKLLRSALLR